MATVPRPAGSRAAEAFAEARRVLAGYRPDPADRPAVGLSVPAPPWRVPPPAAAPAVPDPHGVAGAVALQRAGGVSSRELVTAAIAAHAASDPALAGIVHLDTGAALAEADARDAARAVGVALGPLHGIPVTVKDIIDVQGMPTRAGSDAYERLAEADAASVALLRRAGAVILGKASTHEFALGVTTPQSRNPRDVTRIPGGSSGGSAIAVATGVGLASLGTDTRASIRVPPALCGLVGFKATYGRVPVDGVVTLSWTMDHVAPIAADVRDAALVMETLAPETAGLSGWAGASVAGMVVGVPEAAFAGCDPDVVAAVRAALAGLEDAGVVCVPADRPTAGDLDVANGVGMIVSRAEAVTYHAGLGLDRSRYWEEVADQLDEAEALSAIDYLTAQRMRADLSAGLHRAFAALTAMAMPTTPVTAPPADRFAEYLTVLSRNAIPWSLIGFPAITVPCGVDRDGLPIGVQFVAPPGCEDVLVALGSAVEAAMG